MAYASGARLAVGRRQTGGEDSCCCGLSFTADGGTSRSGKFNEPESGPTGRTRTENGAGYLMEALTLALAQEQVGYSGRCSRVYR